MDFTRSVTQKHHHVKAAQREHEEAALLGDAPALRTHRVDERTIARSLATSAVLSAGLSAGLSARSGGWARGAQYGARGGAQYGARGGDRERLEERNEPCRQKALRPVCARVVLGAARCGAARRPLWEREQGVHQALGGCTLCSERTALGGAEGRARARRGLGT